MRSRLWCAVIGLALLAATGVDQPVHAHGGGNWDPFTISVVNNRARDRAVEAQALVADIIRGRAGRKNWPVDEYDEVRNGLITAKEEVDEILEHFVNDGLNVQMPASLHSQPQAGRTMAASRALTAAIALLERVGAAPSANDFVDEFYAAGQAASLYELIDAHRDRMAVYDLLAMAVTYPRLR